MPGMLHGLPPRDVRSRLEGRSGRGFGSDSEATAAEIPTAEVSSTPVSSAPVAAGPPVPFSNAFPRDAAHVHVVVVESLEDQEGREPVGPEKAVAGVLELVLVLPETLALV